MSDTTVTRAAAAAAGDVLAFWREAGPKKWFTKDAAFDAEIVRRFLPTHEAAAAGQLIEWEGTPDGTFALIVVLDQFPRNMFRSDARAFAADHVARGVADRALVKGFDRRFTMPEQNFFYLPFTHSELIADQERCVALCRASGDANVLKWAEVHRDIIATFGRFPHRNAVLGRTTSPQEQAFLEGGGFAG